MFITFIIGLDLQRRMRNQHFYIIMLMTIKHTHWKYAQEFYIHSKWVTNRPIKLAIYVIFTECLCPIIACVISLKVIAIFKRDVITIVSFLPISELNIASAITSSLIKKYLLNTEKNLTLLQMTSSTLST